MDCRLLVFVTLFTLAALLVGYAEAGKSKRVVIHVPFKIKKVKHTHTIYKTVHHHHTHDAGGRFGHHGYSTNQVVAFARPAAIPGHMVTFARPAAAPAPSERVVTFSKPIVPPKEPEAYGSEVHEHVHHHHVEGKRGKHDAPGFEMPEFFHRHKALVPVFRR